MAWEKVETGTLDDGRSYVIERQVFYLPVPQSTARLPLRRKAYRLRTQQPDGAMITLSHGRSKALARSTSA